MIDAAATDALGSVAAVAVTAAAGYVSAKVRSAVDKIDKAYQKAEESRELAKENRELIAGDPDIGESLVDQLQQLKQTEEQGGPK